MRDGVTAMQGSSAAVGCKEAAGGMAEKRVLSKSHLRFMKKLMTVKRESSQHARTGQAETWGGKAPQAWHCGHRAASQLQPHAIKPSKPWQAAGGSSALVSSLLLLVSRLVLLSLLLVRLLLLQAVKGRQAKAAGKW
jgi:hypothetical protein